MSNSYVDIHFHFLCINLGLWFGDGMSLCLTFDRTTKLLFEVVVPFCISTSNTWKLPLLYYVVNTYIVNLLKMLTATNLCSFISLMFLFAFSYNKWWQASFCILICHSLVKSLFKYLLSFQYGWLSSYIWAVSFIF